ncbi:putative splicing factor U2af large subunit A [Rosellinia necatrix]|uniref:Putative splicing factor U2af large subunit A n=1 Tax=Rosellinia necatrix TaxID=77044 RepID=A0A1S7UME6_ROSNE|nr:putative splicing factor U2af large subunit A [Rosellinia necatrix]
MSMLRNSIGRRVPTRYSRVWITRGMNRFAGSNAPGSRASFGFVGWTRDQARRYLAGRAPLGEVVGESMSEFHLFDLSHLLRHRDSADVEARTRTGGTWQSYMGNWDLAAISRVFRVRVAYEGCRIGTSAQRTPATRFRALRPSLAGDVACCSTPATMAPGAQLFYRLWQESRIRENLFEALSKEDVCNVRLANLACCNLVTKRLFRRTHLTFTPNSFTRQTRIQALSRIGQYIEHLTFYFPHSHATFLAPLIHPQSGREISFLYTPHTSMGSVLERPKFANEGLGEILTSQYPPLFHAASNVPSFINAMKHLVNIRHLTIKTPGQDPKERYRRDIVDYALISLRVALERAPIKKLDKLSMSVHPSAFLYLRPTQGFGCSPSAGRRWKQIRKMHIDIDSWDFYGPSPGLDQLKIIQDFLYNYSTSLEKLTLTWHGRKGPCPIALAADPLFAPPRNSLKLFREVTSPMSPLPPAPPRKPVVFRKLRYLTISNTTMNAAQLADIVAAHQHSVRRFGFENCVLIGDGNWDEALAPLTNNTSRGTHWTRNSMDTATKLTSVYSSVTPRDIYELEPSAAVAAVARNLYTIDFDEPEAEVEYEEHSEGFEVELDSDVEAARQASLSSANKNKKRTVTKRRRKRKPGHERHEDKREKKHQPRGRQHRGRDRQGSHDSHEEHHEVRRLHFPWLKRSKDCPDDHPTLIHPLFREQQRSNRPLHPPREPPPQLTTPHQPPYGGLFGEVESVYSTNSRRLFGEVTPLSRSRPGSEPDLSHSPSDDPDSGDDYFRPQTPTTPEMNISAPILDTSPNMPTLLQPKVYDPTAELCSEITAVQRDIEAEEKHRLMAEDAEMQTSALRRAKELVLTRLGKEFASSNYGAGAGGRLSPKKESFGPSAFLSSTRFREGLFGKNNGFVVNTAPLAIPDHRTSSCSKAGKLGGTKRRPGKGANPLRNVADDLRTDKKPPEITVTSVFSVSLAVCKFTATTTTATNLSFRPLADPV